MRHRGQRAMGGSAAIDPQLPSVSARKSPAALDSFDPLVGKKNMETESCQQRCDHSRPRKARVIT